MIISNFNTGEKVLVVAEIGNNHEGNFNKAVEMVHLAAESGADAVKFQTILAENFISIGNASRIEQLKKYSFSLSQFVELSQVASKDGLIFLTTPFDIESVDAIYDMVPAYKISSGDNTFWPLIEHVARKNKPMIVSAGLATVDELERSVEIVKKSSLTENVKDKLAFLHCVCAYPAQQDDLNLNAIPFLKDRFNVEIGYSDHYCGIEACIAAVALGARIIEKHFTYKKQGQQFRDHALSADPKELKLMISHIRKIEKMLGHKEKVILDIEKEGIENYRRSIAAKRDIPQGDRITMADITWLRPGTGLPPGKESLIIDCIAKRLIKKGEIFILGEML